MDRTTKKSWYKRHSVTIVILPLLIGIHWGWWKMQQNPDWVDPKYKKELPIFNMYQITKRFLTGESPKPTVQKVEDKEILKD